MIKHTLEVISNDKMLELFRAYNFSRRDCAKIIEMSESTFKGKLYENKGYGKFTDEEKIRIEKYFLAMILDIMETFNF